MAHGKTAEVRPAGRTSDRYYVLIRELPLRPISSDKELDRAIAMIDRLLARDELARDEQDYLDVLSDLAEVGYKVIAGKFVAGFCEPGLSTVAGLTETGYKVMALFTSCRPLPCRTDTFVGWMRFGSPTRFTSLPLVQTVAQVAWRTTRFTRSPPKSGGTAKSTTTGQSVATSSCRITFTFSHLIIKESNRFPSLWVSGKSGLRNIAIVGSASRCHCGNLSFSIICFDLQKAMKRNGSMFATIQSAPV